MNTFSRIAHSNLEICSPVPWPLYREVFKKINLKPNPLILDIGCGKCGLLSKTIQLLGGKGIGIDLPEGLVQDLTPEAFSFIEEEKITLLLGDAQETLSKMTTQEYDLIFCIGSSHALEGPQKTLPLLKPLLQEQGFFILGELLWAKKPSGEFLNFLQCSEEDQRYHHDLQEIFKQNSLKIHDMISCPLQDFDTYEENFRAGILSWCEKNKHHPNKNKFQKKIEDWSHAREKWGRDEFAFNIYFLKKDL